MCPIFCRVQYIRHTIKRVCAVIPGRRGSFAVDCARQSLCRVLRTHGKSAHSCSGCARHHWNSLCASQPMAQKTHRNKKRSTILWLTKKLLTKWPCDKTISPSSTSPNQKMHQKAHKNSTMLPVALKQALPPSLPLCFLVLFRSQNAKCKIFVNHLHGVLNVIKK